jgi:hypothetical protein
VEDAENLAECQLDPDLRERLLNEQVECTFIWTNKAGQPFGVAMSFIWRNGSIWLTAAGTRARIPSHGLRSRDDLVGRHFDRPWQDRVGARALHRARRSSNA